MPIEWEDKAEAFEQLTVPCAMLLLICQEQGKREQARLTQYDLRNLRWSCGSYVYGRSLSSGQQRCPGRIYVLISEPLLYFSPQKYNKEAGNDTRVQQCALSDKFLPASILQS